MSPLELPESRSVFAIADFVSVVKERVASLDSRLVVGIDPDPALLNPDDPVVRRVFGSEPEQILDGFCHTVIEAVYDKAVCVKPQSAFFECWGLVGFAALSRCIAAARSRQVPVILDAKRGDVGNTARAYARAYLDRRSPFFSDALTVSPYLGEDALIPFVEEARRNGCGLFVLVRTSNPGSGTIQALRLRGGRTVAEEVAAMVDRLGQQALCPSDGDYSLVGAVVGLTHPEDIAKLRSLMPRAMLLLPGFGAQGGRAEDARAAFRAGGNGALVAASRSITGLSVEGVPWAVPDSKTQFAEAVRIRAERARQEINRACFRASI